MKEQIEEHRKKAKEEVLKYPDAKDATIPVGGLEAEGRPDCGHAP
jgi:hypothetical protein